MLVHCICAIWEHQSHTYNNHVLCVLPCVSGLSHGRSSKAEALLQQLAAQQSGSAAGAPAPLPTPTPAALEALSTPSSTAAPSSASAAGSFLEQLQQQPNTLLAQLQPPKLEALTPPPGVDWQALQSKVNGMQPQLDQLQPDWQQLQPHWGAQVVQQALEAARAALQLPANTNSSSSSSSGSWSNPAAPIRDALSSAAQQVQVPDIHLPEVHLPQLSPPELPAVDFSSATFQLPSAQALLQAASSAASSAQQLAGSAASGAGQLPGQLAAAASGQVEVGPHFGSQAVAAWLSQLAAWLQQLAEAPLAAAGGAVGGEWILILSVCSRTSSSRPSRTCQVDVFLCAAAKIITCEGSSWAVVVTRHDPLVAAAATQRTHQCACTAACYSTPCPPPPPHTTHRSSNSPFG
jgi:hypothetical protein